MHIKVKKLFNGCISVRDYIVKKCLDSRKSLTVHYKNEAMVISPEELEKSGYKNNFKFHSKWGDKDYDLIDYKWKPQITPSLFSFL